MSEHKVKAGFNKHFREVNECRKRYRILRGSAGSGKSVDIAMDYIIKLSSMKYEGANLLVLRKTEDTNRNSTFAELQGAIYRLFGAATPAIWNITTSPLMIENRITGSQIIFRGMNDEKQREKVKSITFKKGKLTWIWLEEATEFAESDIDVLDDRMRGFLENPNLYYQMTCTFNPVSAAHWIKSKWFDIVNDDVFTHHSTYLQNRFIDEAYHRRMMLRKERDPAGYVVYGLGFWGELGGLILTHWDTYDFDISPERFDAMYLGQDFGFQTNAILELGWKDGEIYVCKEIYHHEKATDEIIGLAEGLFDKNLIMWCDSAEPDRIKMWKDAGYHARGVKKSPLKEKDILARASKNSYVCSQIDWLKQHKIHVHPSCTNLIKELSQWKWEKDEKANVYTDKPVPFFDHAIAALRYGCESLMHYVASIFDNV